MSQVVNSESAQLVETNHHSEGGAYASVVEIEIEKLGINTARLVRPIDPAYVAELAETDETEWEPLEICVWHDKWVKPTQLVEYEIVSGNHRTSAAHIKGLKKLHARIIEANTELDYTLAGIRTNARHGRNFTNDERKALAFKLRDLGRSSREIAKDLGVNKSSVNNWFSGRDSNASKKAIANEKKAQAQRMLEEEEQNLVDEEWASLPPTSIEVQQLVETRREIVDFLRTPAVINKPHIVAFIRSISNDELERENMLAGIDTAQNLLRNVRALLSGE
ncbi:MAG TPA: ParB/RepB/Spo0J family partition protein [Ktedonobacteraceae bacterium]|jgi:transposase|nr:ParB/RepB/Spo0J family partition protein [Ktedonobacteraceae bacterium]